MIKAMKIIFTICTLFLLALPLHAEEIGAVAAKGYVMKDHIRVKAFDDPDIKGVTCYTTFYDRSFSISDSSDSSISCRKTGPIEGKLGDNPNVFSQSKSFLRNTVVHRFYDSKRGVLIYLSYTKGSGKSASHSLSVVVIK